jgi:hypothetical protein
MLIDDIWEKRIARLGAGVLRRSLGAALWSAAEALLIAAMLRRRAGIAPRASQAVSA